MPYQIKLYDESGKLLGTTLIQNDPKTLQVLELRTTDPLIPGKRYFTRKPLTDDAFQDITTAGVLTIDQADIVQAFSVIEPPGQKAVQLYDDGKPGERIFVPDTFPGIIVHNDRYYIRCEAGGNYIYTSSEPPLRAAPPTRKV